MSEFDQADGVLPEEKPDPEEFEGTEPGAESEDTGTHYDVFGEPETTPHDQEIVVDDSDDAE
jgi:hypothetical protein